MQPIYHNRAIWPFVSAYALRAARDARTTRHASRTSCARSCGRRARLARTMENYELVSRAVHVDDGKLERARWSIRRASCGRWRAMLDVVVEGVFGVGDGGQHRTEDARVVGCCRCCLATRKKITLAILPASASPWCAGQRSMAICWWPVTTSRGRRNHRVQLQAIHVRRQTAAHSTHPLFAAGHARCARGHRDEQMRVGTGALLLNGKGVLYLDGHRVGADRKQPRLAQAATRQCFRTHARRRRRSRIACPAWPPAGVRGALSRRRAVAAGQRQRDGSYQRVVRLRKRSRSDQHRRHRRREDCSRIVRWCSATARSDRDAA